MTTNGSSQGLSLDDIDKPPPPKEGDEIAKREQKLIELNQKSVVASRSQELGFFGKFFGYGRQSVFNFAFLVIIASLISIVLITYFPPNDENIEILELFKFILFAAVGYLFGSQSKSS